MAEPTTPVTFAPGKIVRLTKDWCGISAGTEFMLSGEVITDPWDAGKLAAVRNPADPGAHDHGRYRIPRDVLEFTNGPCQCPTCKAAKADG
jgi:hypothetical protein